MPELLCSFHGCLRGSAVSLTGKEVTVENFHKVTCGALAEQQVAHIWGREGGVKSADILERRWSVSCDAKEAGVQSFLCLLTQILPSIS